MKDDSTTWTFQIIPQNGSSKLLIYTIIQLINYYYYYTT